MSRGSLLIGLCDLVNLRLPWKPGGLCSIDGLDMEVTMTDDIVLHAVLAPDSSVTLSSCCRQRKTERDVEVSRRRVSTERRRRRLDVGVKGKNAAMQVEVMGEFYQLLL